MYGHINSLSRVPRGRNNRVYLRLVFGLLILLLSVAFHLNSTEESEMIMVSFSDLAQQSSDEDLVSTMVELAYLGPALKLLPSVDFTGGDDPLAAREILLDQDALNIPPAGAPFAFTITPTQMRNIFTEWGNLPAASSDSPLLGLFAYQPTTQKGVVLQLDSNAALQSLQALLNVLEDPDKQEVVTLFGGVFFPASFGGE